MHQGHKDELVQTIKELARYYNKTLPALAMRAYWGSLKFCTLEQVQNTLTKLYDDPPRYLPSAKALYMLIKTSEGGSTPSVWGAGQRRRGEIAAVRAALEGREAAFRTKTGKYGFWEDGAVCHIKLMGIKTHAPLLPVHEMHTDDLNAWLEIWERQAAEDAQPPPYSDPGKVEALKEATRGVGRA